MAEQNASVGYLALKKETVKGTAVTPNVFVPYYSQSMNTDQGLISDEPIYGYKFKRYQTLSGMRKHSGSIKAMAEPNTAAYLHDMVMGRGTPSGTGPYTYPFVVSTTNPNSYTMDISYGSYVERFTGVEASKLGYGWDSDKMVFDVDVTGLSSFNHAVVSSIVTTTVNLVTSDNRLSPTSGLVVGDAVKIVRADGTSGSFTIATITDGDTVVLNATAAAFAAGDYLVLAPQSPAFSLLYPFTWERTSFHFGANATAALAASQTRLDPGTEVSVSHEIKEDDSHRSGAFDIASIVRGDYDAEIKAKTFLDNPSKVKEWNAITKQAFIMRAYSGSSNQYELRFTANDIRALTNDHPTEKSGTIFHEFAYSPNFDATDAQAIDVKVINNISTI